MHNLEERNGCITCTVSKYDWHGVCPCFSLSLFRFNVLSDQFLYNSAGLVKNTINKPMKSVGVLINLCIHTSLLTKVI